MRNAGNNAEQVRRVGCVSYLNAKPLIHDLPAEGEPDAIDLQLDVPSRLIGRLLSEETSGVINSGGVDLALCSVVDHFHHPEATRLVPVGGIACEGPTLTVRLFSRVPIENVAAVHADTDSHTSVLLLRVLLHDLYGLSPAFIHYDTRAALADDRPVDPARPPEAMLLIGDKVVTHAPPATAYPYQLDLGAAWHDLTGKPFVFATWLARTADGAADISDLAKQLAARLDRNLKRLDEIVDRYAADHGWPADLAAEYLGRILRYTIGPRELDAIEYFRGRLRALGLIPADRATQQAQQQQ